VRVGEAKNQLFLLFNIITPYETKDAFYPHPASPASPKTQKHKQKILKYGKIKCCYILNKKV
jgi:hypothetical protein